MKKLRTIADPPAIFSIILFSFLSTILLGPDGKVLVFDQKKLKGEQLSQTLDQILPR